MNESGEQGSHRFRARFVPNSFRNLSRGLQASHCDTLRTPLPASATRATPPGNMMPFRRHRRNCRPATAARGAGVTAVLGPTNTGKTHLAIERMLAHSSGMIGLPLRLLAREVYNKIVERVGAESGRPRSPAKRRSSRRSRASGSPPSRRCRGISTCRFSRSTKSRSPPISSAAMSSPTACSPARPRRDAAARCRHHAPDHRAAAAGRVHRHAGRGCRSSNSPATARSRGSRGAPRSSRSRPTRSTRSPN